MSASAIETAIARARRAYARQEAPIRQRLAEAYRRALAAVLADLDAIAAELAGAPLPASWFDDTGRFTPLGEQLYRQSRLARLAPLIEAEFRRFSDDALAALDAGMARVAVSGGAAAAELLDAAGFGVALNRPAVVRLTGALDPASPLREVLDRYGARAADVIADELLHAAIAGEGPRQVRERIIQRVGPAATTDRLDTLVRTELMRAWRGSLFDQYAAVGVARWRWTATYSTRTCLACLAMDGWTFPMTQRFLPAHPRCRCVPTPDVPEAGTRTGADWFAAQPASVQRTMLPSRAAYDAYRAGLLTLDDFVGQTVSPIWGPAIYERSGRSALRAAGVM